MSAKSAQSLKIDEGFVNPIGFYDPVPKFSWQLPEGVKRQSAYRIELKSDKSKWDSGWIESEQSTFAPYTGAPLASREQFSWRIKFRDDRKKESSWSDWAHAEIGLLSAGDWKAQWIRPAYDTEFSEERVGWLRRSFDAKKKIAQARIYVTARGLFELRLNGERVGQDHFANGFTPYQKRLDTLTYDVTKQLRSGGNQLEAMLGTGWYAGRLPFGTTNRGPYGKDPELLLQLEIVYSDGSREDIVSDGQWEGTLDGPVLSSSLYDGENYDARKEPTAWKPVVADSSLGSATLAPKPFTPVQETQRLKPRTITEPQAGHFIFDLGQNMVGWARIKLPVEKDQTITLHFAEMLNADGTLYNANYRTAKSTDTYTAGKSGTIEWEPHFTFHGFRYIEVTGVPAGAKPSKDWVTGIVLHSAMRKIGNFESSNAKLNQLQSNIEWGWRSNSVDIPTDCPQRDERMGWTGDAQVFSPTALLNTDSAAFWRSWLRSMRDEQSSDGVIPDIVPAVAVEWRNKSPGWIDAATFIPWTVYLHTGDTGVLKENYTMMEKLVGWYRSQAVDGIESNIKGYGDWLQPYPKTQSASGDWMGDRHGDTPSALLGTAYYARSAQILADTAKVLGFAEDSKRYSDEATKIRSAFYHHYFDTEGKLKNTLETQTAYVLALAFELVPDASKVKVAAHLARLVAEAGNHLRTGFLGTPYIVPVLDQTGRSDLAYALLFQESYPSWFYSINQGATTMWERWNSYSHEAGFGDVEMNSFNHYAYGAIGQWLYERVAGLALDPASPGYKHFFIRPLIGNELSSAHAEIETPYGKAASSWKKKNGKIALDVIVPPNTTATIAFPDGRAPQTVSAGTHHFE